MKIFLMLFFTIVNFSCGSKKSFDVSPENKLHPSSGQETGHNEKNVDLSNRARKAADGGDVSGKVSDSKLSSTSEKFRYSVDGNKYSATLSALQSPLGMEGVINLLDLPPTIPVVMERKTHTSAFEFIYSSEKKEFRCSRPNSDAGTLIWASGLRQFAGIMSLQWLHENDSLGRDILESAKETDLYKKLKLVKLTIEKPNFDTTMERFESSASNFSGKSQSYVEYRMKKILTSRNVMMLNAEVCDLVQETFVIPVFYGDLEKSHSFSIKYIN